METTTLAVVPASGDAPRLDHPTFYRLWVSSQDSERTREGYDGAMRDFGVFIRQPSAPAAVSYLLSLGRGEVNAIATGYRTWMLEERKLSPATVNVRLSALRDVIREARKYDLVDFEISVDSVPSRSYRDTAGPGSEAFRAMLLKLAERQDDPKRRRDLAILWLLYGMGLRRSEVVSLNLDDVTLGAVGGEGTVLVTGKGHKDASGITMPPVAASALRSWIEVRGNHDGPLFVGIDRGGSLGGRLTGESVRLLVAKLGDAVGVRARPHGLRHSAISRVLDLSNGNVREAQKFSRHANVATVVIYDDQRTDAAGRMAKMLTEDCIATAGG